MRCTDAARARSARQICLGVAPAMAAALAVLLSGSLTGCGGSPGRVRLPARPPARSPSAPAKAAATTSTSVKQQVIAAFTGYTIALGQADRSRNAAVARSLLRPYLAASRIDGLVQAMSSIWAQGKVFYGQDVLHITNVSIGSGEAFVHDCDDTSGMGLEYAATGGPVPGSAGIPQENVVTRLDLTAGRWLVQFQLIEDVPCTA